MLDLGACLVELSRLVKFTPTPPREGADVRWRVVKAEKATFGHVGRILGVLEIKGARAHGFVVQLEDNRILCFADMDLVPHQPEALARTA